MPENLNLINQGILDADELDEVYAKLLRNPGWKAYKTQNSVRKVDAWVMRDPMPARLIFLKSLMKLLCDLAKGRLEKSEGKLIPMQLFICLYEDGSDSCPVHRHDCKQITLSLGSPRRMVIDGRSQILAHGDATFLAKEQHSIPKEPVASPRSTSSSSRISLNFFYTTTSNPSASVTPRLKRSAPEEPTSQTVLRRRRE
eukprot:TRINITY_DN38111_c0_g1_i1.p1 TRINITY_DN38111_c0_g1~~TRINITY_DN38111_c0_g1_i1.p1  ORF type:complete len:209 (+),score=22.91 TRINITY_DN38111_c0_g1_i1:33-629(+)